MLKNDSNFKDNLLYTKELDTITNRKKSPYSKFFLSEYTEIAFYFKINDSKLDPYLGILRVHKIDLEKTIELKKVYLKIFENIKHVDAGLDYEEIKEDISNTFFRVSGGKLK